MDTDFLKKVGGKLATFFKTHWPGVVFGVCVGFVIGAELYR